MTDDQELFGRASHGDAQSDIFGGTTIVVSILFFAAAIALVMVAVLALNAMHKAQAEKTRAEQSEEQAELASKATTDVQQRLRATLDNLQRVQGQARSSERTISQYTQAIEEWDKALSHARQTIADLEARNRILQRDHQDLNMQHRVTLSAVQRLERDLDQCRADSRRRVDTGKLLWVYPKGDAIIVDAEPQGNHWRVRFDCEGSNRRMPVAKPGGGDPNIQEHRLGR